MRRHDWSSAAGGRMLVLRKMESHLSVFFFCVPWFVSPAAPVYHSGVMMSYQPDTSWRVQLTSPLSSNRAVCYYILFFFYHLWFACPLKTSLYIRENKGNTNKSDFNSKQGRNYDIVKETKTSVVSKDNSRFHKTERFSLVLMFDFKQTMSSRGQKLIISNVKH